MIIRDEEIELDRKLSILISRTAPDYIVEIGSFDGSALVHFGKSSPYSKRIGFEANPTNFFNLCLGKDIQYMAVSNKTGTVNFYEQLPDSKVKSSRGRNLKKTGSIFKVVGPTEFAEYTVPCTTLDDFFKIEIENNKTFVLIIDAEGAAKEILEGGKNFLKNTICLKIELESEVVFIDQALEKSSFDLLKNMILIGDQDSGGQKVKQKNYYFVSNESHAVSFITY